MVEEERRLRLQRPRWRPQHCLHPLLPIETPILLPWLRRQARWMCPPFLCWYCNNNNEHVTPSSLLLSDCQTNIQLFFFFFSHSINQSIKRVEEPKSPTPQSKQQTTTVTTAGGDGNKGSTTPSSPSSQPTSPSTPLKREDKEELIKKKLEVQKRLEELRLKRLQQGAGGGTGGGGGADRARLRMVGTEGGGDGDTTPPLTTSDEVKTYTPAKVVNTKAADSGTNNNWKWWMCVREMCVRGMWCMWRCV